VPVVETGWGGEILTPYIRTLLSFRDRPTHGYSLPPRRRCFRTIAHTCLQRMRCPRLRAWVSQRCDLHVEAEDCTREELEGWTGETDSEMFAIGDDT